MYKNLSEVLTIAEEYKFIVGSFNMHNLEMLPMMIRSAKKSGSPIIIQTSVSTANYIGMKVISNVCKTVANDEGIDVVLHLDHATEFEDIKAAIDAGYTSVMYDGSKLDFKQNVLNTKRVVQYAHMHNVSVEGELGTIKGCEDGMIESEKNYTDPQKAQEFVCATGVDALAVSVGTQHGSYTGKTNINFGLLKKINEQVGCPLVIHGGTGVKDQDIAQCCLYGVRKFNVGTELLVGWTRMAQKMFAKTAENNSLRNNIIPCNQIVSETIEQKIKLFTSDDNV